MLAQLDTFGRVHGGRFQIAEINMISKHSAAFLPYGNGKSYGDSCLPQVGGKAVLALKEPEAVFDSATGLLVASPGLMLGDIILKYGPLGWFLPVTPGTKHVTLGGAIANDVHGKNHHVRGTFGCHVAWFDLLRSDGVVRRCSPTENTDMFSATIGGVGLTGVITKAAIRLFKVPGASVLERTIPFNSLDDYFAMSDAIDTGNEYAVAWLDQLASGSRFGRGLVFAGNHVEAPFAAHKKPLVSMPFTPPVSLLNGLSVRAFNTLYRFAKSRHSAPKIVPYDPFFYPLDMVDHWNRFYGPNGLHQHQSVIPVEAANTIIPAMLQASRDAGQVSFLTVIKKFGVKASPGLISFARAGYTLTLDFPHRGAKTLKLLDRLDAMTVDAGGAVNPYKDSRMSPQTFEASFPNWRELEALRDPAFQSAFWARTAARL